MTLLKQTKYLSKIMVDNGKISRFADKPDYFGIFTASIAENSWNVFVNKTLDYIPVLRYCPFHY